MSVGIKSGPFLNHFLGDFPLGIGILGPSKCQKFPACGRLSPLEIYTLDPGNPLLGKISDLQKSGSRKQGGFLDRDVLMATVSIGEETMLPRPMTIGISLFILLAKFNFSISKTRCLFVKTHKETAKKNKVIQHNNIIWSCRNFQNLFHCIIAFEIPDAFQRIANSNHR